MARCHTTTETKYSVNLMWVHGFQVMDKLDVNGEDAHPLYKYLKYAQPVSQPGSKGPGFGNPFGDAGAIEWNYTKFLVDRQGRPVKRYKPGFDPLEFEDDVRYLCLSWFDPAENSSRIRV